MVVTVEKGDGGRFSRLQAYRVYVKVEKTSNKHNIFNGTSGTTFPTKECLCSVTFISGQQKGR